MSLWLKVRRWRITLVVLTATVLLLLLTEGTKVSIPSLLQGLTFPVPLGLFLPIGIAIAVGSGLTSGDLELERVASRPLGALDAIYALSVAACLIAVAGLIALTDDSGVAVAAGRNGAGLIGMTLVARAWLPISLTGALPAAMVVAASLFGRVDGGETAIWAWPVAGAHDGIAYGIALGFLILGSAAITFKQRSA